MTLYEYRCVACRARFTERRALADRNLPAACPECGCAARRALSAPIVHAGVWSRPMDPEKLRTTEEIWK